MQEGVQEKRGRSVRNLFEQRDIQTGGDRTPQDTLDTIEHKQSDNYIGLGEPSACMP